MRFLCLLWIVCFELHMTTFCNAVELPTVRKKLIVKVCVGPSCNNSNRGLDAEEIFAVVNRKYMPSEVFDLDKTQCFNACKRPCNIGIYAENDGLDENGKFKKNYPLAIPGMTSVELSKNCFSNIRSTEDVERAIELLTKFSKTKVHE